MKNKNKYNFQQILSRVLLSAVLSIAISCSSSVRFAGDANHSTSKSVAKTSPKANQGDWKVIVPDVKASDIGELRANIIKTAKSKMGTPYCYGGNGDSDCLDCSGFVKFVFDKNNIILPRTAAEQRESLAETGANKAKPGDLVFFKDGKKISHVGIYLGEDVFIHASTSSGVMISSLKDPYFACNFAGYGKIPVKSVNLSKK